MSPKEYSAVVEEPRKIVLREFDIPTIGEEDALLKIEMTGVCGSDPGIYKGRGKEFFPLILGHEILGHIDKIGDKASKRYGVKPGDRVIVESTISCGSCYYCITGNYKFCEKGSYYGTRMSARTPPHLWGAYGQYMYIAPGSIVHKISPDVPAEAAVLTNAVIANGIHWLRILGGASPGNAVVIQGSGPQGLAATIAAKESGASPIIVSGLSKDAERFKLAREFGADICIDVQKEKIVERVSQITLGRMADVVLDVTGNPQGILNSVELVRKQGTLVCAGITGPETVTPLLMDRIVFREVKLQGAFTCSYQAVLAAIKLVESRKYPLEKMVTHKFSLKEAEKALSFVGGEVPGSLPIKAVIVPD